MQRCSRRGTLAERSHPGDRPLRILHLGNVANNAYLNAKLLNAAGHQCDVLSYSHYHLMSSPEWEDSDFSGATPEEFRPDWRGVDLNGFERPRWFAEGPFLPAADYLIARRLRSSTEKARWWWLETRRQLIVGRSWAPARRVRQSLRTRSTVSAGPRNADQDGHRHPLAQRFREVFPARHDQLTDTEIETFGSAQGWTPRRLLTLFDGYDVVHAYGSEPILPMIAGFRPWVAFEHGTIRALPFSDTGLGRLVALAYHDADAVIITNADNRAAAIRLGIKSFRFVPHPINEYVPDAGAVSRLRAELCARLGADFLVFHPSRQHWGPERNPSLEKGNDILIDGLAQFFGSRKGAAAVFVSWGERQDATRRRLADLGISAKVHWIDPVPTPALSRYMAAADVVADQFFLGAFGAITPRALFLGVAPLLYLDVAAHRWCFHQPPPVLNARQPQQIATLLLEMAGNRERLREVGELGRLWYQTHHSNATVVRGLAATYVDVMARAAVV